LDEAFNRPPRHAFDACEEFEMLAYRELVQESVELRAISHLGSDLLLLQLHVES
jgi:hypothetical protein